MRFKLKKAAFMLKSLQKYRNKTWLEKDVHKHGNKKKHEGGCKPGKTRTQVNTNQRGKRKQNYTQCTLDKRLSK